MSDDLSNLVDEISREEKLPVDIPEDPIEDLSQLNPIQNRYTFWHKSEVDKANRANYKDCIKKIASFQSAERFWQIYDHMKRPFDFKSAEFHLFKDGIFPIWEDPQNKAGGKWTIRLKKGIASRYWEDILLAMIGEQFDVGSEICGAVLSVRMNEDLISVWNKTADNQEAVNKIREQIRRIVRLPNLVTVEYKRHQESLVDRSSYRNPSMVWRAPSKSSEGQSNARFGNFNKQHSEGNKHATTTDGVNKTAWKTNRWSGGENDINVRSDKKIGDSSTEWRKAGKDGGDYVKPNRAVADGSDGNIQSDLNQTTAANDSNDSVSKSMKPSAEVWTKVKNPFSKDK